MTLFEDEDKLVLSSMFNSIYFKICHSDPFGMFLTNDSLFPGTKDKIKWILLFALFMLLMFCVTHMLINRGFGPCLYPEKIKPISAPQIMLM